MPLDALVAQLTAEPKAAHGTDPNLQGLHDAGISIWLDTLSRELLDSGQFTELIRDYAVTGATSNPTIFAKAITGSDRYDDAARGLAADGGSDPQELFFTIALDDVRHAADQLRPVYDAAAGATDSSRSSARPISPTTLQATIDQAIELWQRLNGPT